MRNLLAVCLIVACQLAFAGETGQAPASVRGVVMESIDVSAGYTYLRLKTDGGESWAAIPRSMVKKGEAVTLVNVTVMHDFKSNTLNRTFPTILFGSLAQGGMANPHAGMKPNAPAAVADIHVAKAAGSNARTVAEIVSGAAALKGKTVQVRGKVVKYNPGIMGRNWVHLADGSGSAEAGTNDILVTTSDTAKVGDVVTAEGVVQTDKDFGAGYYYKVLLENSKLRK